MKTTEKGCSDSWEALDLGQLGQAWSSDLVSSKHVHCAGGPRLDNLLEFAFLVLLLAEVGNVSSLFHGVQESAFLVGHEEVMQRLKDLDPVEGGQEGTEDKWVRSRTRDQASVHSLLCIALVLAVLHLLLVGLFLLGPLPLCMSSSAFLVS